MEFEKLEKPIQEIITLVEKLAEPYREKCFEILLSNYLRKAFPLETARETEEGEEGEQAEEKKEFLVPLKVRGFLSSYDIPEENLQKLFLMEENEVVPIYRITTTQNAAAQIQIALLSALENALRAKGNKFEFAIETVRQRCKTHKVYDAPNFAAIFSRYERYFTSLGEEEHVELSPEGKTELAEVILTVAKK